MKTPRLTFVLFACLLLMAVIRSEAAETSFNISLATPQLQTLQTSIPVGADTAEVSLAFIYNTRGQVIATADSTVDGTPATCVGSAVKRGTNVNYVLTIKAATVPATTVVLRGVLDGATAAATYSGPKGRARISAQPVSITSLAPVPAHAAISNSVNARGIISGTGSITAYGTNSSVPGKLRGMVKTNKLTLALTQAPRVISFNGSRSNDVYVGSLKVTVPPARETIQPFQVPASAFPIANGSATFQGTVLAASNSLPAAASGVKITIKSDINGDGAFLGKEMATAMTDAQGRYQVPFSVSLERPVLLEISLAGYAKYMTAYPNVTPGSVVMKNHTMQALTSLSVNAGTAQSDDGRIMLMGLPSNISRVDARVFNPVTETAQFPGEFADGENNLLVSSVFSAIEARNAAGSPVTNLGASTMLCMEVPRDTWNTMGDLTPGNGQLDIPLYFYDEATGEWKRNSANGWLEDSNHAKIPEAQLAAVQNGSFSGRVYGVGPITHLSYWNIDWPISTHTTIRGILVDTNSQPVQGASVIVMGLTYTGSSSPLITQADGTFCVDIMRSEVPGEDVDRDGVTGETQQVRITAQRGTTFYTFGPFNSPLSQSDCSTGNGLNAGLLGLIEANRLAATSCTITGRMVYSGIAVGGTSPLNAGDPIVDAAVFGYDPTATDLLAECLENGTCGSGQTDADGYFSFTTVILSGVSVFGSKTDAAGTSGFDYFNTASAFTDCPPGPITLSADYSSSRFLLLNLTGGNIQDGTFSLINNQPVVTFTLNGVIYVGASPNQQGRPTSTGPWLTLNLINANTTGPAGTISFTVTSLSPLTGTWTTSTLGASGTFDEQSF